MITCVSIAKGGTSKSTTCWALSSVFRRLSTPPKKVLLVDADPQASLSMLLNLDESRTIADVLKGRSIFECVQETEYNGDIIAGSAELPLLSNNELSRLPSVLREIEPYYDYIIIDSTPTLSAVALSILHATDKLIIPATASLPVILSIKQFGDLVNVAKQHNSKLEIVGILMTMFDKRLIVSKAMRETAEEVAKQLGTKVFDTTIRKGVVVEEAFASFKDLVSYSKDSNVTKDYQSLVKELESTCGF